MRYRYTCHCIRRPGRSTPNQCVTFAVHHPSQEAIAYALNLPGTYYQAFQAMYETKRQLMLSALDSAGLKYFAPQGTYFVMADYSEVFNGSPLEFTRYLTREIGVACIPPETFYSREHAHIGHGYVRFAFCKSDELLRQVQERLAKTGSKWEHVSEIAGHFNMQIGVSFPQNEIGGGPLVIRDHQAR